jgi:hypothetical protein
VFPQPDVEGDDLTARRARQELSTLDGPEGDREVGAHGARREFAGAGVDAGCKVEGDDDRAVPARFVDAGRRFGDRPAERTLCTGPQEGVDDDVRG